MFEPAEPTKIASVRSRSLERLLPVAKGTKGIRKRPSHRNANFFGSTVSTSVLIPTGRRPRNTPRLSGDAQFSFNHKVSEGTKRQVCCGRWGLSSGDLFQRAPLNGIPTLVRETSVRQP